MTAPFAPPLAADIDAWVAGQPALGAWFANAVQNPGTAVVAFVVGWTRNDDTQHFAHVSDPSASPEAATLLRGLMQAYGTVLVRVYTFTWTTPAPASMAAAAAVQTAANTPASWAVS